MMTRADWRARLIEVQEDLRYSEASRHQHKDLDIEAIKEYILWLRIRVGSAPDFVRDER
jgi:hypothetical protein